MNATERFTIAVGAVQKALDVICKDYPPGMTKTPRIKAAAGRVKDAEAKYLSGEMTLSAFLATLDVWQAVVISEATKFLGEQKPIEVIMDPVMPEEQPRQAPDVQEKLI